MNGCFMNKEHINVSTDKKKYSKISSYFCIGFFSSETEISKSWKNLLVVLILDLDLFTGT